jgi:hypothetical protein
MHCKDRFHPWTTAGFSCGFQEGRILLISFFCLFFCETGFHYVGQASFKLMILLPCPLEYWTYRHALPCLHILQISSAISQSHLCPTGPQHTGSCTGFGACSLSWTVAGAPWRAHEAAERSSSPQLLGLPYSCVDALRFLRAPMPSVVNTGPALTQCHGMTHSENDQAVNGLSGHRGGSLED